MEPHAHPNGHDRHSGLLGWLGFGKHDPREEHSRHAATLPTNRARETLLDRIAAFLLDNTLEVTAENLLTAHCIFAGLNPGLLRRVRARLAAGGRIDQAWLDHEIADCPAP